MRLFGGKKNKVSISFVESVNGKIRKVSASEKDVDRFQKDMTHLTPKGELPWGWYAANRLFTEKIHSEYSYFFNEWLAAKKLSPVKQYGTLKSLVMYLNDAQKLCSSKGECFAKWFDDIIADEKYISARTAELKELEQNIDQLQNQYEKRQNEIIDIDSKIISKLKENEGILQSDFVKMFDVSVQNDVKEKLYFMEKSGDIQRTKSGRSYILHMK